MKVFIIPSWYPSASEPTTGIFIRNQALALATNFPDWQVGIGHWGSHRKELWIDKASGFQNLVKLFQKLPDATSTQLSKNCHEIFVPARTWSRKWKNGNIDEIIKACDDAFLRFKSLHGIPDIIHAHVSYPAGYVAYKLAQKYHVPYVITEHMTPFPFESLSSKNGNPIPPIQIAIENCAAVIAVNKNLADVIEAKTNVSCGVIYNQVDETNFFPKKINPEHTAIFVGRLTSQKAIKTLCLAIEIILNRIPSFTLKLVGDGENRSLIQSLIKKYPSQIDWIPFVPNDQLPQHYNGIQFLILPSLHENNPLVILEALACGKPVVATACGGPEEIINEKNGLLAKPGDPNDLAAKIEQMLHSLDQYDPQNIREDFEKRFSAKVVTTQIRQLYEEVIQAHHIQG